MHWNIFIFRLFHYLQIVVQYTEKDNAIVSILSCVCFVFWEFAHGFWILGEKSQHWRTVTISDLPDVGLTPAVFMKKKRPRLTFLNVYELWVKSCKVTKMYFTDDTAEQSRCEYGVRMRIHNSNQILSPRVSRTQRRQGDQSASWEKKNTLFIQAAH